MNKFHFTVAQAEDLNVVQQLLDRCGLPSQDVAEHLPHFILAKDQAQLAGVIGLEPLASVGLLRSLAVAEAFRGQGLGYQLYQRLVRQAHQQGINSLYLLTLTAEGFFEKLGFQKISRAQTPSALQGTREFQSLCPDSAVCMVKSIDEKDAVQLSLAGS